MSRGRLAAVVSTGPRMARCRCVAEIADTCSWPSNGWTRRALRVDSLWAPVINILAATPNHNLVHKFGRPRSTAAAILTVSKGARDHEPLMSRISGLSLAAPRIACMRPIAASLWLQS